MKTTFLDKPEDMEWLLTTHLKGRDLPFAPRAAILYGNEDAPARVEIYRDAAPLVTDIPFTVTLDL